MSPWAEVCAAIALAVSGYGGYEDCLAVGGQTIERSNELYDLAYVTSDAGWKRLPVRVFSPFINENGDTLDIAAGVAISQLDPCWGGPFEFVYYVENKARRSSYLICNLYASTGYMGLSFSDGCRFIEDDYLYWNFHAWDDVCKPLGEWDVLPAGKALGPASAFSYCADSVMSCEEQSPGRVRFLCNVSSTARISVLWNLNYFDAVTSKVLRATSYAEYNLIEIGALVFSGDGGVGAPDDAAVPDDDGGSALPDTTAPHANRDAGNAPPEPEIPEIEPGAHDGGSEAFSAHRELAAGESCACAGSEPCGGSLLWILLLCLRGRRQARLPNPRHVLTPRPRAREAE